MRHPLDPGYRITSTFSKAHPGTDYAPPAKGQTGVPCYAPEKSTVIASSYNSALEGEYVILQGKDTGKFYYFGHFARNSRRVSVGQVIAEGTVIAMLGMTGKATGIHTHCEVRDARNSAFAGKHDPEAWFNKHITKGDDMTLSTEAVKTLYRRLFNREGDAGGVKNYTGKTLDFALKDMVGSKEFKAIHTVNNTVVVEKPVEVIKEVVKEVIVEKPVEVIREVERVVEKPVPLSDLSMGQLFEALVNKIVRR